MARRGYQITAVTTSKILYLITLSLLSLTSSFAVDPQPPFLLPLTLSPRHNSSSSSRSFLDARRRHLQNLAPNAHMRLYDDLLSNGYYTTRLYIGTPAQEFALIVDTGSTVTYVPCSSCDQCGNHQDPKFQPDLSTSYHAVQCNPDCTCDAENSQCTYERTYAEMSTSSGILGEDIISFGNQSALKPQQAVFGCENAETGDLYSQHADGIMGLGRGDLSIVDQLVDKGVINDSFSLCYGGMDIGGGAMVLGQISHPSDMAFTKSDPDRSPYYNIDLRELHVAGKKLPVKPSVFDGKHGTVLDSGTTYAYLPEAAFAAFKHAIMTELSGLKQIRGPDPNYNDICFSGGESDVSKLSKTFPTVDMVFETGQKYSLSPENYLFKHSKVPGAYCLGVFQNGKDPTTLLGGIVVRNTLVTYDRQNLKVGFWKTNCSELFERLNKSGTSLAPAPFIDEASTVSIPPASAPDGSPDVIPAEKLIGVITFDMSLSIKESDLKPRISELSSSIAQELGVNSSQVHFLNMSSSGNGSLVTWSIYPEGSTEYFSNATAMNILTRLAKNSVQLPETFGHYKLLKWNTQPPVQRSWWHQHYLVVVVGIIVTLMLGLSVYGVWFVWRWRQETTITYKPVNSDTAVSEQELTSIVNEQQ